MASGMARSHRGLAGTLNPHPPATTRSPSAGVDILVRSAATRTSTRRLTRCRPPRARGRSGSTAEASVPRPAGGAAAAASTACALAARPRRPRGTASSSTSTAGPPDPPVPAAATAGVRGEQPPKRRARGRRRPGWNRLRSPGRGARGVSPVRGQPVAVVRLGTISTAHVFRHVSRRFSKMQDPGSWWEEVP